MIKGILTLCFLLSFASCNPAKLTNSNGHKQNKKTIPDNKNLNGIYSSGCVNEGSKSFTDTFEFDKMEAVVAVVNYDGEDCPEGKELEQYRSTYSFNYNGNLIEFIKGQYFYTSYKSNLASLHNHGRGFCNISDWSEGQEQEITGQNCEGDSFITGERFLVNAIKKISSLVINENIYNKMN